jgi:hypothetical protein
MVKITITIESLSNGGQMINLHTDAEQQLPEEVPFAKALLATLPQLIDQLKPNAPLLAVLEGSNESPTIKAALERARRGGQF